MNTKPMSVDAYISSFPDDVARKLRKLRTVIRKAAPGCEEGISYSMPAYKLNGPIVYFAAYEHHIGFYPTGEGMKSFAARFNNYKTSKGAVQFPLVKPLPYELIAEIVKQRVEANKNKTSLLTRTHGIGK